MTSATLRNVPARRAFAALAALVLAAVPQTLRAEDYLLGPQDQVRLKVYEWRASRDTIFEWTALNDKFTVGPDGALSLPLAGTVKAEGTTVEKLAEDIGMKLMKRMGLGVRPDTAVEVVQFRPFYISGQVTTPGEYPYRPSLTVLQAVSIAGGLRTKEDSLTRMEREIISGQGDVGVLSLNQLTLLARKARLEAELDESGKITFPPAIAQQAGDSRFATVMEQERSIFRTRRDGLETQVKALESLKVTLAQEVTSLEGQLGFQDKQIELIQKELTSVSSLVDKGLAVAPREMSLEREMAQFQSGRLAAQTSLLRARQEIGRTDISIVELKNRYSNEVTVTLRDTQAQLDELQRKKDTAVQLLHESEVFAPRLLALRARAAELQPNYTIVRPGPAGSRTVEADENTLVKPGDTVKVEIPLMDESDLTNIGALSSGPSVPAGSASVQDAHEGGAALAATTE